MQKIFDLIAQNAPTNAYIVGGWLRDRLLKRANRDLDIITPEDPLPLAKTIAKKLSASLVKLDTENKIYRVVLKAHPDLDYIDFAKFKGPTLEKDLGLRDFTINALAFRLDAGKPFTPAGIIDLLGGKQDLKKKTIRLCAASAFKDDPLRLMRAYRFAGILGFTIEPGTDKAIRANAHRVTSAAMERIREELFKLLACSDAARWIPALEKSGVLRKIFPEATTMKSSARKFYFHPDGLWQHAVETLASLEAIWGKAERIFPGVAPQLREHMNETTSLGITRLTLLKFIALFHDTAKPGCAMKVGKKMRFIGHEKKGAVMIADILRRLKASNREIRLAKTLVEHHMRPVSLTQTEELTQRAAMRLFRDLADDTPDLLLLALSDWHSYKRLKMAQPVPLKQQEATVRELFRRYYTDKTKLEARPLINGHDIMTHFSLQPGKHIGTLLAAVREAQLLGRIATPDEAYACANSVLTRLQKRDKIALQKQSKNT